MEEKPFRVENNVYIGKEENFECPYDSVGPLLLEKLKETPETVIFVDDLLKKEHTCDEIRRKSVKCAVWLRKQGIGEGDIVGVYSKICIDAIVPFLATYLVGATLTTWTTIKSKIYASQLVELLRPKVTFVDEESALVVTEAAEAENVDTKVIVIGQLPNYQTLSDILDDATVTDAEVHGFECKPIVNKSGPGHIVYTSGSTGVPKGVPIAHETLRLMHVILGGIKNTESTMLLSSTLAWVSAVIMIHLATLNKVKFVIPVDMTEESIYKAIESHKVNITFMGPSALRNLASSDIAKKYDLSSLKRVLCGGAILNTFYHEQLRKCLPGFTIMQGYGMSEICGSITSQTDKYCKHGSTGVVASNVRIKIIDPVSGNVREPHQIGEICFKAKYMMNGYYKNEEATNSAIDAEGWLHTGDLGYFDEDGELFIADRMKDLIKYRSFQISPSEIESVLQTHPAVLEACVVALPDQTDELPLAFVVTNNKHEVTEQELIDLVANQMEDFQRLRGGLKFLEEFPKTASGKVDRKALKQLAATFTSTLLR